MTAARAILILCALALAGCAAGKPPAPDRPDCLHPVEKPPIEGGIGGTGKQDNDCEE